jgi:hypothetical protein
MLDTYYYAKVGARFTGNTVPMTYAKPSQGFRAEARLARALGDEELAKKWDRQAEMEEEFEDTCKFR